MSDTPTPPPGFELLPPPAPAAIPAPPAGFVIEGAAPAQQSGSSGWLPRAIAQGVGDLVGAPASLTQGWRTARDGLLGLVLSPENMERAGAALAPGDRATQALGAALPSQEGTTRLIESGMRGVGIEPNDPQTAAGRIVSDGARFAAGSILPGGLVRNIVAGGVAGLASGGAGEGAKALGVGPTGEAVARVAGALSPAGMGVARNVLLGNPTRDAAQALRTLSPAQADEARALMEMAERMGTPITVAEAAQQVGGGNRALYAAQDLAQNSTGGRRVMDPFLDARDAGARTAADRITAPLNPGALDPGVIPQRIQEGAAAELNAARAQRSQAVRPLYDAATARVGADPALAQQVDAILGRSLTNLDAMGRNNPAIGEVVGRLRERLAVGQGDWEALQDVRRELRDLMGARTAAGSPVLDRKLGAMVGQEVDTLTGRLKRAVPELAQADAEYIRLSRDLVDPVQSGIVGRVAQTNDAAAQRALLFPQNPMGASVPTTPASAGRAMEQIGGTNPIRNRVDLETADATRGLMGAELQSRLDEALRLSRSGPTDRAGAAIASRLAPTDRRQDALLSSLAATPGGQPQVGPLGDLLEVLRAQSYAPTRGSQTAMRGEALDRAGAGGAQALARAVANPFSAVRDAAQDWRRGASTEALARALVTPQGFDQLRAMSGLDPQGFRNALAVALTGNRLAVAAEPRP